MQSKQKITLYIPPELHRKLKIKAAIDIESMSALVEKAISFYIQHPEKVEQVEAFSQGKTHQVHLCPECDNAMVMRDGQMVSLTTEIAATAEDISLRMRSEVDSSGEPQQEELVPCL